MSIELKGLEEVFESLDNAVSQEELVRRMKKATKLVERTARQTAPKGDGDLRRSIASNVTTFGNDVIGTVYTPLEYAPYVEYGTGLFAEENPRAGYWVYVKDSSGSTVEAKSSKRYTLEKAKQIVAMMRDEGLEAVYTQGRAPHPFMRPALNAYREKIKEILGRANQ